MAEMSQGLGLRQRTEGQRRCRARKHDGRSDAEDASTAQLIKREREKWMVEERKRGHVRTITVAARKRLIKWYLAQWASAPHSWWRRERMSFDSREKDGGGFKGCVRKVVGMQRNQAGREVETHGILCIGQGNVVYCSGSKQTDTKNADP